MNMEKKNKKISKEKLIQIIFVITIAITLTNILILSYTNVIPIDFNIGHAFMIGTMSYLVYIFFFG